MSDSSALQTAFGKVKSHGLRYSAASVVNVIIGQALLFILLRAFTWGTEWSNDISWTVANVLAVSISAIPAYYLNRAWVWGKRGRSHLTREILPFWGFALAGLVLSTLAVNFAAGVTDVKIVANIANIAAFGLLWVVKFFVLDSAVFGPGHHGPDEGEVEGGSVTEPSAAGVETSTSGRTTPTP